MFGHSVFGHRIALLRGAIWLFFGHPLEHYHTMDVLLRPDDVASQCIAWCSSTWSPITKGAPGAAIAISRACRGVSGHAAPAAEVEEAPPF
jgi:hypothetical protein